MSEITPTPAGNQPHTPRPAAETSDPRLVSEVREEARVLPVIEERVVIRREVVEAGRVRITRRVHEHDEEVLVPMHHDEVQVERVPLNQTLPAGAPAPLTRYEGDTMIIPVLREVAVVETRLLLVEELRVTKRQVTTQHSEPVHLRREELTVEHLPPTPPEAPAA
jgi:uncharacterized protein (TIGR02271 family)